MRYVILVVSLGAVLGAQAPPPPAPSQQTPQDSMRRVYEQSAADGPATAAQSGQSKPDAAGGATEPGKGAGAPALKWRLLPWEKTAQPPIPRWKLFPFGKSPAPVSTPLRLVPGGTPGQPVVAHPRQVKVVTVQPRRLCAIPLTNAIRPSEPSEPLLGPRPIPLPGAAQLPMKEAALPAPSCGDMLQLRPPSGEQRK